MRHLDGHNSPRMRLLNRGSVLALLLARGPMARRDIARELRLTPATITNATRELIAAGLVAEQRKADRGGEPRSGKAVPVDLRADGAFAVGINLGADATVVAVVDLKGAIRDETVIPHRECAVPAVVRTLAEAVERTLVGSRVDRARVIGVGLGVAGVVDPDAGIVRSHLGLGWRDVALGPALATALGWPVQLANNVHAMAVAERLHGAASDVDSSVLLYVGATMGAGLVVGGDLHRGHASAAGLIGHVSLDPAGPLCDCGNRGCLQAVVSHQAVVLAARAALAGGRASLIEPGALEAISPAAMAIVYWAAARGDDLAVELLADRARQVGAAAALLLSILDPDRLVLGGLAEEWSIDLRGATALELVRRTARERARLLGDVEARIVVGRLGGQAWSRGAADIVLARFLSDGPFELGRAGAAPDGDRDGGRERGAGQAAG
jgi:predicted NBD/HSP70 family sugar kinase